MLRIPMPNHVLAFRLATEAFGTLSEAVGRDKLTHFHDAEQLESQLALVADVSVVASVPDRGHEVLSEDVVGLRQRFPHVPLIAVFYPTKSSHMAVLQFGAAGVTQIVIAEPALRRSDLVTALSKSHGDGVAIRLWHHVGLSLPEPLVPVIKAAIRMAHAPISNALLGDATGMHERSLRKYCTSNDLPSPQWIIGWARLLVAGFYLDEPGRTISQVAELLRFPSPCALRNQLQRYSSVSSRRLRATGPSISIARRLEDAIRDQREHRPAITS